MRLISEPSQDAKDIHNESYVIDIHCHPSIKVKLFDYKIYERVHKLLLFPVNLSPDDEIFQMQYDLHQMYSAGIDAVWSSIYVVEHGLIDYSTLKYGGWIAHFLKINELDSAIERLNDSSAFVQALDLMHRFELQVQVAQNRLFKTSFVKNFTELKAALDNNEICFIHSLEGAHMLGRNYPDTNTFLERLQVYIDSGVCSMTLGHFMPNNICTPVNGISPKTKDKLNFTYDYTGNENVGLSDTGKNVVDLMLDKGMIVDLNHVSPRGRKDVFEINSKWKRPLVFSHNGVRNMCNELICPDDEEIIKIKESGGVIGIIFMNYWLNGSEAEPDYGIDNIINTIKYISNLCGSFENIAIGSDMDGFTQPVDDLYSSSQMIRLTQAMLDENFSTDDIQKVLGLNALRVLEAGWGK